MKHYQLLAIFPEDSATAGVFEALELAQNTAETHTPIASKQWDTNPEKILWRPYYQSPGDPPTRWEGVISQRFKSCDWCKETVQWLIILCELNTYWLR